MLEKQIMRFPPTWIPPSPTLQNFADVLTKQPFGRYILNSLLVALIVTLGQLIVASMGAYAFARLRFPGRDRIFLLYLATMIIPTQVTLIRSMSSSASWLGQQLRRTDRALSLQRPPHLSLAAVLPLSIPRDLEDSARIDGAGYFRTFATIVIPLSGPALATSALLAFMGSWTNFLWPLIVTRSRDLRTVPVGLAALQEEMSRTNYAQIMAGSVLAMLPMFISFSSCKYIIASVATTGMKA